jgi:hypothetical protein
MKRRFPLTLGIGTLAAAGLLIGAPQPHSAAAGEQKSTLADAPEAVRTALAKFCAPDVVRRVQVETKEGETKYEVVFTDKDGKVTVTFAPAGDVMEIERVTAFDGIPEAGRAALRSGFPYAEVKRTEAIELRYFEVKLAVDGKEKELKVFASGLIEEEKAEEPEEEENDED